MLSGLLWFALLTCTLQYSEALNDNLFLWTMNDAQEGTNYLLYSNQSVFAFIRNETQHVTFQTRRFKSSFRFYGAIATDNRKPRSIFVHDKVNGYIHRLDEQFNDEAFFRGSSLKVEDIAVDWLSLNVYYTDPRLGIGLVSYRKYFTIILHKVATLAGIDVDPQSNLIFYTDPEEGHVYQSTLRGKNKRILSGFPTGKPTALVVDVSLRTVYWIDVENHQLKSWNYETSSFKNLGNLAVERGTIVDIDLFENYFILARLEHSFSTLLRNDSSMHTRTMELPNTTRSYGIAISAHERQSNTFSICSSNPCQHICLHDVNHTPRCLCQFGFIQQGVNCKSELLEDNFLLFVDSSSNTIYEVNPKTEEFRAVSLPPSVVSSIENVVVDPFDENIYWIEKNTEIIWRMRLQDLNPEMFTDFKRNSAVVAVTIALRSSKIYYIDLSLKQIRRIDLKTKKDEFILQFSSTEEPRQIQVDERQRILYLSDCGNNPKIESFRLDDVQIRSILVSEDLQRPSLLALDSDGNHLYWVDEGKRSLEKVEVNGNNREIFSVTPANCKGLVVDADFVYLAHSRALVKIDKENRIQKSIGPEYFLVSSGLSYYTSSEIKWDISEQTSNRSNHLIIYIAAAAGGILLVVMIGMLAWCMKRRTAQRSRRSGNSQHSVTQTEMNSPRPVPETPVQPTSISVDDPWYEPLKVRPEPPSRHPHRY